MARFAIVMSAFAVIFMIALAWVVYTYAGYPLLLWLGARLRPRAHAAGSAETMPSVSIVVAARNEESTISRRLDELMGSIAKNGLRGEIILVSDGSTDGTESLARRKSGQAVPVTVIALPENVGKAAAISMGCEAAVNDVIVLADARQTWAPDALVRLLENFSDPTIGGASGELILEKAPGVQGGVGMYWRYEKWIRRTEALVGSTVGVSGSICAVRRRLFTPIPQGTILDDVYWPMRVVMQGYRIVHDHRAHAFDRLPPKSADEFHRKVRTLSGNFQLIVRLPALLVPWRNPIWVQFVSHKLMRLAVPWAMLLMLACCLFDQSIPSRVMLAGQILFYAIGLAATIAGDRPRIFMGSTIASFIMLNAAAWTAFWVWITGRATRSWSKTVYHGGVRG